MRIAAILDTRSKRKNDLYPIYIRLQDKGKRKYLSTGYRIEERYWNGTEVKRNHPMGSAINAYIADKIAAIKKAWATNKIERDDFDITKEDKQCRSFCDFLFNQAISYEKRDMIFKSVYVARMHREFKEIVGDIYADEITPVVVSKLDEYFIKCNNAPNTRAKKIKTFREQFRLFKKASGLNVANPFEDYKVKGSKVSKEKLTEEDIEAIEKLKLTGWPELARDIFLFQFYTKGQRVGVVIMARWEQIKDGRLYFVQGKNSEPVSVQLHPKLKKLLTKYKGKSDYIFNLVKREPTTDDQRIRIISSATTQINKYLKIVAEKLGSSKNITSHIARHSFASQLMSHTDSIFVIKDALGHSDIRTTQAYTKTLMDNHIDAEVGRVYGKK